MDKYEKADNMGLVAKCIEDNQEYKCSVPYCKADAKLVDILFQGEEITYTLGSDKTPRFVLLLKE